MFPDFKKADQILKNAADEGRWFLFEHEGYDLLGAIGLGSPPEHIVIRNPENLHSIDLPDADRFVLKIIHPDIAHKSDVGGVRFVSRDEIFEQVRSMFSDVPLNHAEYLNKHGEDGNPEQIADSTHGILVNVFTPAKDGFGNELFIGMRDTREFGPVINAGLGGLDTELFAKNFVRGRSGITISPGVSDEEEFYRAFTETVAYETLTGSARGHKRHVDDETLADALAKFHALVWRYSPLNPDAPFHLTECEINPFIIDNGNLVPVDSLIRFTTVKPSRPDSPVEKIENLLKPKNICVIGVSAKSMNLGRVTLRNLLKGNFTPETLAIVKDGDDEIDGVKCYPSIESLPGKFDLVVLSVAAPQVPGLVSDMIEHEKAESIILITGGMGEKEGAENLEDLLRRTIDKSRERPDQGPVMVGGNSLGVISGPGGYDTMFVPPSKLPKNPDNPLNQKIALVSQSGAYMITRMSKIGDLLPRYAISTGNQVDLGVADFVEHIASDSEVKVFGCYAEGLGRLEGLKFAESARKIVSGGRDVVVYKAGRSSEGRKAASGHTAAIAGDWDVAEAILSRCGCHVAESFKEYQNLLMLSAMLEGREVGGDRLVAISNAGYETVGIADNLHTPYFSFSFAKISDVLRSNLSTVLDDFKLSELVNIRNPMDVTPMAVDRAHVEIMKVFADDPDVDVIIHGCVPLSPIMKTREPGGPDGDGIADPEGFTKLMIGACGKIDKPVLLVIDSGSLYDPMADMFIQAGIPVFRSADEAVRSLARWIRFRAGKKDLTVLS